MKRHPEIEKYQKDQHVSFKRKRKRKKAPMDRVDTEECASPSTLSSPSAVPNRMEWMAGRQCISESRLHPINDINEIDPCLPKNTFNTNTQEPEARLNVPAAPQTSVNYGVANVVSGFGSPDMNAATHVTVTGVRNTTLPTISVSNTSIYTNTCTGSTISNVANTRRNCLENLDVSDDDVGIICNNNNSGPETPAETLDRKADDSEASSVASPVTPSSTPLLSPNSDSAHAYAYTPQAPDGTYDAFPPSASSTSMLASPSSGPSSPPSSLYTSSSFLHQESYSYFNKYMTSSSPLPLPSTSSLSLSSSSSLSSLPNKSLSPTSSLRTASLSQISSPIKPSISSSLSTSAASQPSISESSYLSMPPISPLPSSLSSSSSSSSSLSSSSSSSSKPFNSQSSYLNPPSKHRYRHHQHSHSHAHSHALSHSHSTSPSSSSSSSSSSSTHPSSTPLTPPPTPPTSVLSPCQQTFREAVENGDTIELQRLLEEREGKINVNLFDHEGQTALHHGCLKGNLELVKLLVRFGANVRLANRDGWHPLHLAAYGGHTDILTYLTRC